MKIETMKRRPKIRITLLIAALLTAAFSFVIPNDAEDVKRELFWSRKTFARPVYDVLLLGDSRLYRGLSPEAMKPHLPGLKILNFGYSNGGLNPTMFEAAEEKLAENNKPKVIVLGISANTVTGYSADNQHYLQEVNRPREQLIERMYFHPLRQWFPSTSPRKLLQLFAENKDSSFYRHTYHKSGYVASEKFPIDTTEAIPLYTDDFRNYKVEEKFLEPLFRQVEEWSNEGITVVAFRPPVSQPMRELENTMGRFDEQHIKNEINRAGGYWIELNPSEYKTYDGSHLTIESARKLSVKVANSISELIQ